MSRPLLHPLADGGRVTRVPPGQWTELTQPTAAGEIDLTEATDQRRRGRITSVPTPWARLQLFRDAMLDERHPFRDEALNDVLDTLEVVLFQDFLTGVSLHVERVELEDVRRVAAETHNPGVLRFVQALRELAPVVDRATDARLTSIAVARNGVAADAPIVFATSPFTLFFTPQMRRGELRGYYTGPGPLRPLAARPPELARYVRDLLLPQLGTGEAGRVPELQQLKKVLGEQLAAVRGLDAARFAERDPALTEVALQPAPGVVLHRLAHFPGASALAIKARRPGASHATAPLVLENSGSAAQERYFPWLARPAGTRIDWRTGRDVLPNTSWKHEWVFPEEDFLAQKLLVLDAPLFGDRVYGPNAAASVGVGGGDAQRKALRVLLPLKARFFEFFRAADVPELVAMRVTVGEASIRAQVTLTIPTAGGDVVVQRSYETHTAVDSHLSVWPGFAPAPGAFEWRDYYLVHHLEGGDAREEVAVKLSAGGAPIPTTEYQRVGDTVLYHFAAPPEVIHLHYKHAPLGDPNVAEGVILPRLKVLGAPTQPPWTVAIDFGTSNTTVAYRAPGRAPEPLRITEATRLDLTQGRANEGERYFNAFFYPPVLEPRPFGTVVFRSRGVDAASDAAQLPALTANVPFRGEIVAADPDPTSARGNELVGDLKWGGGGSDSERLTKLFLHQVLQVVYAESLARGCRADGVEVRWSYPIAFSGRRQQAAASRWRTLLADFRTNRMGLAPAEAGDGDAAALDESVASMLHFIRDPASQGQFNPNAPNIKLTADVGGGTTDVAARARGRTLFLTSMLFGGRDLVHGDEIYARIEDWAVRRGLPNFQQGVLRAYPTSHTRLTYLARLPWFAENAHTLADEPWFMPLQACVLYFFGAIVYNIGIRLRGVTDADVEPADMLFFAGNGSNFLSWLTGFASWNKSPMATAFGDVLHGVFETAVGRTLEHTLDIKASSNPKHEVALGLLHNEADGGRAALRQTAASPTHAPVGEAIAMAGEGGPSQSLTPEEALHGTMLGRAGVGGLEYERPFPEWEISRFNAAFARLLPTLAGPVDPGWRVVAGHVKAAMQGLTERYYKNAVTLELQDQLDQDTDVKLSLFVTEARLTLRELERRLLL